jgi:ADP-sugar diphosphatase
MSIAHSFTCPVSVLFSKSIQNSLHQASPFLFKGKSVDVTIQHPPNPKDYFHSPLFQNWLGRLDPTFNLKAVEIGFLKFRSTIERKGVPIPRIVLLRGNAVSILIKIIDDQTKEEFTILTEQPRVSIGKMIIEIPAGMVDGSGNIH